jgi:hypothetical protein
VRCGDRDQDALVSNIYSSQTMRHAYSYETMLRVDGFADREESLEREGSVGGVGEMCDGFLLEGVARTT